MLVIDKYFQLMGVAHQHEDDDEEIVPLSGQRPPKADAGPSEKERKIAHSVMVTTIGLVVHSMADGIALGSAVYASAAKGTKHLDVLIFLAILLHKVPASVGFVTYMKLSGVAIATLQRNLVAFTLSSPVSSVVVYIVIGLISTPDSV